MLANLALDLADVDGQAVQALDIGPLHTGGWILNVVIVWLVILLVLAVTGRLWITLGITGILTLAIGAINVAKLTLRNDPLKLSDQSFLSQPGFLVEMVGAATASCSASPRSSSSWRWPGASASSPTAGSPT